MVYFPIFKQSEGAIASSFRLLAEGAIAAIRAGQDCVKGRHYPCGAVDATVLLEFLVGGPYSRVDNIHPDPCS